MKDKVVWIRTGLLAFLALSAIITLYFSITSSQGSNLWFQSWITNLSAGLVQVLIIYLVLEVIVEVFEKNEEARIRKVIEARDIMNNQGLILNQFYAATTTEARFSVLAVMNAIRLLSGADLTIGMTRPLNLENLNLSNFNFSETTFSKSLFAGCTLNDTSFASANLYQTKFVNTRGSRSSFSEAKMQEASFIECDLAFPVFQKTILEKADFSGARLENADFSEANLTSAIFKSVVAQSAIFSGADMRKIDFGRATLTYAKFLGADLRGADFSDADISGGEIDESTRFDRTTRMPDGKYWSSNNDFLLFTRSG